MKALGYTVQVHGLSVLINLPDGSQDRTIAHYAYNFGLAPSPLSAWYQPGVAEKSGLLLGVSGKEGEPLLHACERLDRLIRKLA